MSIWEHIVHHLRNGELLAFLCVLRSEGSSPGRKGFCMMVNEGGEMAGSIGGGIMEQKLVELAKAKLTAGAFAPFTMNQVHRKDNKNNQSGMICSGEQTIAFYTLNTTHIGLFTKVVDCFQKGTEGILELSDHGISFSSDTTTAEPISDIITEGETWTVRQPVGFANKVYILGAGHVGTALATMMRQIGFYVVILDDRRGLNTMEENQSAHEKHYVDYDSVANHIQEGDHVYVAIVSFGYRTDKEVLKNLAGRKYKYLGMMGSKEKVKKLLNELAEEGVDKSWLNSVHTPIGLPIYSKTPEEIAISIAAEIIEMKNRVVRQCEASP